MYQKESEEIKLSSWLHEKNDELQSQLDNAHEQLLELQVEKKKVLIKYMELKDKKRPYDYTVCTYLRYATYAYVYIHTYVHMFFDIKLSVLHMYTTVVTIL